MNIALIGMPTSGKSTVGVVLAKLLGLDFADTDILIQKKYGKKLKDIIEKQGTDGFLKLEAEIIASLDFKNTVIATGGSVVYSHKAMSNLKRIAKVIYLQVELAELENRMTDLRARGVAIRQGQTLEDLYNERISLYERYADVTINEKDKDLDATVVDILTYVNRLKNI